MCFAQLYVRAGRLDEAGSAGDGLGVKGHAVWAADIERVRGDIVAADWAAAEAAYRSSLGIARRQRAGLFMCKAGLSLARLLQSRGRRKEGHRLLEECLAQLSEGKDLTAVRQARSMIGELRA